jgi:hypothetical protein
MTSNSKLSTYEKSDLKEYKKNNPQVRFFSFPDLRVTVAIIPTGPSMGVFSLSIASDSERKFRRKVGEYYAMVRVSDSQVLPVKLGTDLRTIAQDIALAVSYPN